MSTDAWTDRLSDYLDGDMAPAERVRMEEHLAGCAACATALAELALVVDRARALPAAPPARDLWPGIAGAIGAPAPGVRPLRVAPGGAQRRLSFSIPQLAAAGFVLALGSALVGRFVVAEPDAPLAAESPAGAVRTVSDVVPPPGYAEELSRLELALAEGRSRLDPNTVRILEKNLAVIDRAIRESQDALATDPGNAFLEDHLERAYRGKVDYLRQATALLSWGV